MTARPPPDDGPTSPEEGEDPDSQSPASPFGPVPVILLLLLVAAAFFVIFRLKEVSTTEDCVMSGRKNCAPVDTTNLK